MRLQLSSTSLLSYSSDGNTLSYGALIACNNKKKIYINMDWTEFFNVTYEYSFIFTKKNILIAHYLLMNNSMHKSLERQYDFHILFNDYVKIASLAHLKNENERIRIEIEWRR